MTAGFPAGVMAVLATPFDASGSVDLVSLRRLVEHQLGSGVDALVCFGLAGEGYKLTDGEREAVLREVVEVVAGQVPVVASTDHNSAVAAVERTERALHVGASGVMAYPPTFVPASDDEVVEYYVAIRKTGADVIVQDAPAWTRTPLPVDLLGRVNEAASGVAVKVEIMPSAPKIRELASRGVTTVGGYGGLHVAEELEAGVAAIMPGCGSPNLFVRMWSAHRRGAADEVRASWHEALPVLAFQMQSLDVFVATQKYLLRRAGVIDHLTIRPPGSMLTNEQLEWFDVLLRGTSPSGDLS